MKIDISFIADIVGIGTFLLSGVNLLILYRIRRKRFNKKYYPRKIAELKSLNSEIISICPLNNSKQEIAYQKITLTRAVISCLLKGNSILMKIWIIYTFRRLLIMHAWFFWRNKIKTTNIRYLHEKIDIFLYKYQDKLLREKIEGEINGN